MMLQILERIHQNRTTLSTIRTAHNQFAKGIVLVQRPSSKGSESGYDRAPLYTNVCQTLGGKDGHRRLLEEYGLI